MHKKYLQIFLILFIGSLLIAPMVFAQGDINEEVYDIGIGFAAPDEYSTDEGISNLINDIYRNALIIGGIAAVAVIIYGAIYLTISGASPDKQKEGKDIITSAIWGVILLFGAFILLNTINPQLIEIDPPGGRTNTSTAVRVGQNQVASCIDDVSDTEYNKCQQRVVVNGEGIYPPVCQDEGFVPKCSTDDDSGEDKFFCEGNIPNNSTPSCKTGFLTCVAGSNVICVDINTPESEPIDWVGDCSSRFENVINKGAIGLFTGTCKDKIETKTVTIEAGGAYAQALYYPRNKSPKQAECLVYDYQISPADPIERAGLSGLKLCIGSKE